MSFYLVQCMAHKFSFSGRPLPGVFPQFEQVQLMSSLNNTTFFLSFFFFLNSLSYCSFWFHELISYGHILAFRRLFCTRITHFVGIVSCCNRVSFFLNKITSLHLSPGTSILAKKGVEELCCNFSNFFFIVQSVFYTGKSLPDLLLLIHTQTVLLQQQIYGTDLLFLVQLR